MAGTEVYAVTGLPKVATEKSISQEALNRLGEQKDRGEQLFAALNTDSGKEIVNKIHAQLMNRVNELAANDPACMVLKRLLIDLGITVDLGKVAADRLTNMVTKHIK